MTQLSGLGTRDRYCVAVLVFLLGLSGLVMAEENPSRSQTNHDIRVEPGQKVGDLSCINCSIYIRGDVAGDVFALHGNVVIDGGASVAGDIATLFGDIRVANGGSVAGDVAAIGGAVRRQPQAAIAGDVASLEGKGWLLLLLLCPLVILGLMTALIVWLVHLYRRRRTVAAAA
ncbi:MAG: hypothetical protein DMG73_15315 [Acidobacteria bacterium]|nr:MAG: hypothetical protein DMG75_03255 [Acidobacteriota bacterium]PYX56500.1 MAG: hypothetical protein DMG73_15315 [Acidobacteriota bacterium]PYX62443.1 MAG: hypothetical protein DMG74_20905 [Acidobacteriota bacterium]